MSEWLRLRSAGWSSTTTSPVPIPTFTGLSRGCSRMRATACASLHRVATATACCGPGRRERRNDADLSPGFAQCQADRVLQTFVAWLHGRVAPGGLRHTFAQARDVPDDGDTAGALERGRQRDLMVIDRLAEALEPRHDHRHVTHVRRTDDGAGARVTDHGVGFAHEPEYLVEGEPLVCLLDSTWRRRRSVLDDQFLR